MKFAVMGTGQVGQAIGTKLVQLGHDVLVGSRHPETKRDLPLPVASYAEAARHGGWIVNALPGEQAIGILGGCDVGTKILVDIGNYDHAVDQPIITPLGQALQAALPDTRVVKTLNSVSAQLMVDPAALGKAHSVFIASNDAAAKAEVTNLLQSFGWQDIIDLGDLSACRAMEQIIPLWMALEQHFEGPTFNLVLSAVEPMTEQKPVGPSHISHIFGDKVPNPHSIRIDVQHRCPFHRKLPSGQTL